MSASNNRGRPWRIRGAEAEGERGNEGGGTYRGENTRHDGPEREKARRGVLAPGRSPWFSCADYSERSPLGAPSTGAILSAAALLVVATLLYLGTTIRGSFAGIESSRSAATAPRASGGDAALNALGLSVRSASEIQARIDRAVPGAEIEIPPGIYHGTVDFRGRPVTLRGREGFARTIIIGSSLEGPVVVIRGVRQGVDPRLEGFTLRGGRGDLGAGLVIEGCDPVITQCRFQDNDGGGAVVVGSRALFDECEFLANRAAPFGGGLQSIDSSPVIMACDFHGNAALSGGGAMHVRGGAPMIARSTFDGNITRSGAWGGAIFAENAELTVIDSSLVDNEAKDGGGAAFVRGSRARFSRCVFSGNSAGSAWALSGEGAAIEVCDSRFCGSRELTLGAGVTTGSGNVFDGNCARDCNGNGVPDSFEISEGQAEDCNRNGLIDECEILAGTALDENHDLVPDECGR